MIRSAMLALTLSLLSAAAIAQPVRYVVDLSRAQTQSIDIAVTIPGIDRDTVDISLPVWRPGRYVVLDLAQSLSRVSATDAVGDPLPIEKITKTTWRVQSAGASEVTVSYRLYCNQLSLRTRHVDDTHAFLSGSGVFMYTEQERGRPVRVTLANMPDEWQIATGMDFADGETNTVVAENFDVLVDSPIEAGIQRRAEFMAAGKPHEIALWGQGNWDMDRLSDDFAAIVENQAELFGGVPYERYVFLIHSQPGSGGGTEHINSTIMGADPVTPDNDSRYKRFLGLVSHETFHTWNVKSFRPDGITPYDYLRENYTDLLWVAEGTTSYYDDLTLVRTGLISVDEYLGRLSSSIRSMNARPGRHVQSLAESSHDAWIKQFKSDEDAINQTVSIYREGSLANLVLDLKIREASGGERSLDDAMQLMYERFPLRLGGYTSEQFQAVCEEVAGESLEPFFARYVRSTAPLPLADMLESVGVQLARENDEGPRAYLGMRLNGTRVSTVLDDGPAREAGLIIGDEIIGINGKRFASGSLDGLVADAEPGEPMRITIARYGLIRDIDLTLAERPGGRWTVSKRDDATDAKRAAFEDWLKQAWD